MVESYLAGIIRIVAAIVRVLSIEALGSVGSANPANAATGLEPQQRFAGIHLSKGIGEI